MSVQGGDPVIRIVIVGTNDSSCTFIYSQHERVILFDNLQACWQELRELQDQVWVSVEKINQLRNDLDLVAVGSTHSANDSNELTVGIWSVCQLSLDAFHVH